MLYIITGSISSILFIGCLFGLLQQIARINSRKKKYVYADVPSGFATLSLSVNGFSSSFIAFYSFYIYSMTLEDIEYFIFFTRLAASLLTLYLLFEIYNDRKNYADRLPFQIASSAMFLSIFIFFYRENFMEFGKKYASMLIIFATIIMLQGGIAQILKIIREGCTGALSIQMNILFLMKDVMNVIFGFVLGLTQGWPLILMGSISAALKMATILLFVVYPKE